MNELVVGGSAIAAGFLILIAIIALIASAHPDEKCRRDASRVLDKMLRFIRPFGLRDVGDPPALPPDQSGSDRPSATISGPSTRDPRTGVPHQPAAVESTAVPVDQPPS